MAGGNAGVAIQCSALGGRWDGVGSGRSAGGEVVRVGAIGLLVVVLGEDDDGFDRSS
jgi:hypothetical protein